MDISIDGYDIGGWALHGGEEMSIERSAYEAKKFTFYRVKTAPKEAGIESGRPENDPALDPSRHEGPAQVGDPRQQSGHLVRVEPADGLQGRGAG